MAIAYIEVDYASGPTDKMVDIPPREHWAILHSGSKTVYMINTDETNITKLLSKYPDHVRRDNRADMQKRGLELKPGTATKEEVNKLFTDLKAKESIDVENTIGNSGKSYRQILEATDDIGNGNVKCSKCGTINIQGMVLCSSCKANLEVDGIRHKNPFDISEWS